MGSGGWVPSRFMRKFICRLRLNEVSRQLLLPSVSLCSLELGSGKTPFLAVSDTEISKNDYRHFCHSSKFVKLCKFRII